MATLLNQAISLQPAQRTELLGFSEIVKIRNRVLGLLQQGVPVIRLEGGEPFLPTPQFIKDAMKKALDENQTRYAPSSGVPQLLTAIREKLAERNRFPVRDDQLIVTSGGMHGLFCAFQATLNPGDEILLFSPYWTPIRDLVSFCGAQLVLAPWRDLRQEPIEAVLRRKLTSRTRLIYLNSPSNPSGDVLSREQLEAVARFAVEQNLVVVSDEAYEDLIYEGEHVSIASLPEMFGRTLSVYTLSKTYAMTGWRVGYLAADDVWMPALRKLVLNTINGVSTPTQYASAVAIAERSDYLENIRGEYRMRRDLLVQAVRQAGFRCDTPRGAFYLLVDVRERLGGESWAAMNALLDRTGIASVPGVVFGPEGEGHLRMSFSITLETLQRAVEALRRM
jgi:aspartate aminotransferase